MLAPLPIEEIRPALVAAARRYRRIVLHAPTGSGKSTRVPSMLLDEGLTGPGQIVILQPRRIAARLLARRVAWERGCRLGEEVGYQVRFEGASSPRTRILYETEGILLRQMIANPDLPGVSAILFDEFHERHLYGDVTLAMALLAQQRRRPDLLIGVMSATLDGETLARYLDPCAVLSSHGRTYPVTVEYAAAPAAVAEKPLWEQIGWQVRRLAREETSGDFLIFLPGAMEIHRTVGEIRALPEARDWIVLPLHGELPPADQDAAVDRYEKRKVIVSTNVAETSLTIDGVRVVIDSGLARLPTYDHRRGLNSLLVQKISQASADQRSGRAGRTAPGRTVRLWGEREHRSRPLREAPEIQRLDLSEIVLTLKAGGVDNVEALPWLDQPKPDSLERALSLLRDLGALDESGAITGTGRNMAWFPLHPRFGRLLLEAGRAGCLEKAALIAALAQGRSILLPLDGKKEEERERWLTGDDPPPTDFFPMVRAFEEAAQRSFDQGFCRDWGIHGLASRQAADLTGQLIRLARATGLTEAPQASTETQWVALRRCLLAGFADHLALRLDRGTLRCAMVHGQRGELRRQTLVRQHPLLVSADLEEREVRGEAGILLDLNTAIEEAWLNELFPGEFQERQAVSFDTVQRRVVGRVERVFRGLVLAIKETPAPSLDRAAELLAEEIEAGRLVLKEWDGEVERWIRRVNFLARHCPDYGFAPIGPAERRFLLQQICHGSTAYREIKDLSPWPALRDWLGSALLPLLDKLAPEHTALPRVPRAKLRYEEDGQAILAATVQQLYDAPDTLALAAGRAPVVFEILSPARRPVQITSRLGEFWTTSYPEVKKQLRGRYPKHEWR